MMYAALMVVLAYCFNPSAANTATCQLKDGVMVPTSPQEPTPGCGACLCDEDGELVCQPPPPCHPPLCADYIIPGHNCCPTCPAGNNCKVMLDDSILAEGSEVIVQGHRCTCTMTPENVASGSPVATCTPIQQAPPVQCLLVGGGKMQGIESPGDKWKSEDGCNKCKCKDNGLVVCWETTCEASACDKPGFLPGVCCPFCPGSSPKVCVTDSGIAIKVKELAVMDDGTVCSCNADEDGFLFIHCESIDLDAEKAKIEAKIAKLEQKLVDQKKELTSEHKKLLRTRIRGLKKKLAALQ